MRHPDGALTDTIFANKIAREQQSLFGQKCELDPVRRVARCQSELASDSKKDRTPLGVLSFLEAPPREFPLGTKFAEEFPRKRGTSFRRICELDPVRRVARCQSELASDSKKDRTPLGVLSFLEAPPRFGLGVEVLQTFALPLGYGTVFIMLNYYIKVSRLCQGVK